MNSKKLSVIVPCYNAEKIIDRCLDSLVKQTLGLENMEIILVNDASTDGTLQKLQEWEQQYPDTILVIDSTINMKTGGARNLGIQYASGAYIGFVDNDDWVDATMYEKAYSAAEKYDCDMVSVLYAREREDGYRFPLAMPNGEKNIRVDATKPIPEGIASPPGEVWSKIYRRSLIVENELYFPEGLSYPENYWEPLLRYYIRSYYVVDEILYHYIQYDHSILMTGRYQDLIDRLEIEKKLLQEVQRRGLGNIHSSEMERKFILKYYLNTLHLFFTRSKSDFPYEVFEHMKDEVFSLYPQYYNNTLLLQTCHNGMLFLLRTLEYKMTGELWDQTAREYCNKHFDLSIFLTADRDERAGQSVENAEAFKIAYLLFGRIRENCRNMKTALSADWTDIVWDRYQTEIQKQLQQCEEITVVIRETTGKKWYPYNPDVVVKLWKQAENAFLGHEIELCLQVLQTLEGYLELPEDLYKVAWCKMDLILSEYIPALEFCFLNREEPDLLNHARKIIFDKRSPLFAFPYEETSYDTETDFDSRENMYYFVQDGLRLYFPYVKVSRIEAIQHAAYQLMVEQDFRSPHRYLNERMCVNEGDIVVDAGVAEGNFAASVIQKCSKLYMIECDPSYVKALKVSFRDYLDKIVFVDKFLDAYDDETHITLDTLLQGETVNYIKMDIEGFEIAALRGAEQTLKNSSNLKCNICSYHNLHDYEQIAEILSGYDMEIEHSPGYMFFGFEKEYPNYPRRGLVQAVRQAG